ncbi:hypothetical protein BCEP4_290022 [Burkholderia cepacia]|nr:hypothetical protein BCEP4_290022 [Burkholderia cepacia]
MVRYREDHGRHVHAESDTAALSREARTRKPVAAGENGAVLRIGVTNADRGRIYFDDRQPANDCPAAPALNCSFTIPLIRKSI